MGSYDGAELCELVGLFILKEISDKFGKENVGLYRDDGLMLLLLLLMFIKTLLQLYN
jgi:hypothetical protein